MLSIFILSLCFLYHSVQGASTKLPHIIFILADDVGWNDVGFHGSVQIPSPNIDALAYSGVILNNYYVQPVCTPSRSALMTGLHPVHTGMQHGVIHPSQPYGLPLHYTLLPTHLNELGYVSRHIGKWHLGFYKKEFTPTYRGFKSHYGYWYGKTDYYDHTVYVNDKFWGYDFRRDMEIDRGHHGQYKTDLFTNEAESIITSHNNSQPLFLYLAHGAVHVGNPYDPLQAPWDIVNKFSDIEDENRRKFAGMLTKLDESVGKVVQALEQNQMLKDSIIIFSSDNGGPAAGLEFNAASNWPLRGVKHDLWEGGVRAAGCIWSPLIQQTGRVSMQMIQIMDWLPTLVSAAGGDSNDLPANDGINMWATLVNNSSTQSPRKEILHNIDPLSGQSSLRMGEWKLAIHPGHGGHEWDGWFGPSGRNETEISIEADASSSFMNPLTSKNFNTKRKILKSLRNVLKSPTGKAVKRINPQAFRNIYKTRLDAEVLCGPVPPDATQYCNSAENPCLFHITSDPCEYYDVSKEHPDIVAIMKTRLAEYGETTVEPLNKPSDPFASPVYWDYTWTNWKDFPQPNLKL